MKKLTCIIIAIAILISVFTFNISATEKEPPFTDVSKNAWYYDSVKRAYRDKLIFGTSDNEFGPNDFLTREQAAMIFYNWSGADDKYDSYSFSDVRSGSWYCDAVEWAYRNSIMLGVGNDRFGIGAFITRQDLVTVIYRAYMTNKDREYGYLSDNFYKFTDHNSTSDYAVEAMKFATGLTQCIFDNGIGGAQQPFLYGDNKNMLRPKAPCTRAEAITIIINTNTPRLFA